MRTKPFTTLVAMIFCSIGALTAPAQTNFNSGSDGSYGAMNITADTTLDLPPNGIFHCTTITVAGNVTLSFNRNPLNTPVYLLATGDVTILGAINLSGGFFGGPGGFDGGFAGFALAPAGDGKGPGAGRNGGSARGGVFGQTSNRGANSNTNTYGNVLLLPLIGGSGGAGLDGNPGEVGGGGGGAILIASTTRIAVNGTITSTGGSSYYGSGSGGAIRLVSPVVTGTGTLDVSDGVPSFYAYPGGAGRTRIDCLDRFAFRSLHLPGYATRGSQMFVFPPFTNRLDFVQIGTQSIPVGATNAAQIVLPAGPSTNLTVTVRATGFTNDVPIRVVVTPENGSSTSYDAVIPVPGNPAQTNVIVLIPSGTVSTLNAWTR